MKRLLVLFGLFFIGCSSVTITSNCDQTVNFSAFKTFAIGSYKSGSELMYPEYDNPENRKLIEQAITAQLTEIGYQPVTENPDLLLNYEIIIRDMIDPRVDSAMIYKPWVDTQIDSFNYTEGLLVLRMVDNKKGVLVWQGSLSGVLNKKPNRFDNRLEKYIDRLFYSLKEHVQ